MHPKVSDPLYLARFISCWLCNVLLDPLPIPAIIFIMADVAKGLEYRLVVPHLAYLYKVLGDFEEGQG